jgi:AraC-like DNA-binding protein
MDLLSRLLTGIKISSTSVSKWQFHEGHGVNVKNFAPGYLLAVTSGKTLQVQSESGVMLMSPGDSLIAIAGADCNISLGDRAVLQDINDLPWQGVAHGDYDITRQHSTVSVDVGSGSTSTSMVGIAFELQDWGSVSLPKQLPQMIHLGKDQLQAEELMLKAIEFLINDHEPGYFAMTLQLAEFAVTSAIRSYLLCQNEFPVGVLRGMADKRLSRVLKLMHDSYQEPLTLSQLAETAAMSRSSFAAKFNLDIGDTPINYLNQLRAQQAMVLLRDTDISIELIAERSGFTSGRVMRNMIKKTCGLSPRDYRTQRHSK